MQQITFTKEYLDKFIINYPQTLFEPTFESLKEKRCPLCNNKLKFPLKRRVALCDSVKHGKPFIISLSKLGETK